MSECPKVSDLSIYLDSGEGKKNIKDHLEECLRCQTLLAFWRKMEEYIQNYNKLSCEPSAVTDATTDTDTSEENLEPRLVALEKKVRSMQSMVGEGKPPAPDQKEEGVTYQDRLAGIERSFSTVEHILKKWQMGKTSRIDKTTESFGLGAILKGSGEERYIIQRTLVTKQDGNLYVGERVKTGESVVLKAVPNVSDDEIVVRCIMEGRILIGLDHPNIVKGYDYLLNRDCCFMVMEFVEGETLENRIIKMGRLKTQESCKVVLQVAKALEYLERHSLVHRDIKPSNIVLTKNDKIKLIDFGIAKTGLNITQEGIILGTPYFLSPEQIQGTKMDIKSDIFSLGSTFYYMVTGLVPFTGERALDIMSNILRSTPKKPKKVVEIPKNISELIEDMMNKNPQKRPAPGALIQKLESELKELKNDN